MRKRFFKISILLLIVMFLFSSCATSTSVPPNATPEQLEQINAQNLEAVAKNTSTLAGLQLASLVAGFLIALSNPVY